jgi:anti-sigma regulatory factor (Ser/Thr protein kinase)
MSGRDIPADAPAEVSDAPLPGVELPPEAGGFTHAAIFYHGDGGNGADVGLDWASTMVREAVAAGSPVQVIVPASTKASLLESIGRLNGERVGDMAELGRNPACLIPAGFSLLDEQPRGHAYCLWEPTWPKRSAAELHEVTRHEALVNRAFAGQPMTVACLYDAACLPAGVLDDAERTHPVIISGGRRRASGSYLGGEFPPGCDDPLPPAASEAAYLPFDGQLSPVRDFSGNWARAAGLDAARTRDLVLAVNEVAANALGHAGSGGVVRSWCTEDEFVCQVEDFGHIKDPLAGRRKLPADIAGGHGLWLVNRLCDLVEQRSGREGTVTRLHMRRRTNGKP